MNGMISDIKFLKIDVLSIIIYYPLIRAIYFLTQVFPVISPNVITIFGLCQFVLLAALHLYFENIIYLIAGIFIFSVMDVADGFVARKSKLSSRLGAALDLCADRLFFFFACFLIANYLFSINATTIHWVGFCLYAFLFLYLDSVILIINTLKEQNEKVVNQNKIIGRWSFLFNNQFRFSSYLFICLWLFELSLTFLMLAVIWVVMEYAVFAFKAVKFVGKTSSGE